MKKLLLFLLLGSLAFNESQAQFSRYIVKLKNKGGSPYSFSTPTVYLSQRAIDRRTHYSIAIDSADLPCTPSYINQIKNVPNVSILNISKWLNAVTIQTSDANAITTINGFSFVQSLSGIAARYAQANTDTVPSKIETDFSPVNNSANRGEGITGDYFNYGASAYSEMHLHNGEFLHNIGLRGQGMQIAMLDNGFSNYLSSSFHAFDSCNANSQVLGGWDFVARNATVNDDGNHGMSCFSAIVANIPGTFVGTSPKANFWLYQTEDNTSEYPIEEFNWACGAERADSSGADVISTSLGYNTFDNASLSHTYADMNGNTDMSSIAADLAAKKGILVFAAVGNSGTDSWHYLISPSDGDSVIAVGAVTSAGVVGSFSSYGPSSDGQVKPDIAAVGVSAVVQNSGGGVSLGNGTSFATPKMAGLGTCLWQAFPEFNNMKIRTALWKAGSIYTAPDNRIGYGIPNMKTAFTILLTDYATSTAALNTSNCTVTLNWNSKDVSTMKYEIERKAPGDVAYSKIGEMNPSAGNILSNHSYQFNTSIANIQTGAVSYRIRQIVDTAIATFTAAYVDTAGVNISTVCGIVTADKLRLAPNPTSNNAVDLIVETAYDVPNMPVRIYDMKGNLMAQMQFSKTTGRTTFNLSLGRFAAGVYQLKVYNGEKLLGIVRLVKQ